MAENNKGGILLSAKKSFLRRKTQVLQSLGKTGKTTDEILAEDCARLEKQQEVASKFQKDFRNYLHCARSLAHASKQFYTTASETYETEWDNHEQVTEILKHMDVLWEDYLQKLHDQIQEPLTRYLGIVPQIKSRVAKRGRKLIDYDNAKHNLEVQQNAKKKDDAKTAKAQEDLDHAQKIYEQLNNDLHAELPEYYNSRCGFYGNLFQNLFTAENVFYTEAGKGSAQIAEAGGKLASENSDHTYTPRKNIRSTIIGSDENLVNGHSESGPDSPQPDTPSPSPSPTSLEPPKADRSISNESEENKPVENAIKPTQEVAVNAVDVKVEEPTTAEESPKVEAQLTPEAEEVQATAPSEDKKEEAQIEEPKVNGDLNSSQSKEPELPDSAPPPVPSSPPPEEDNKGDNKGEDKADDKVDDKADDKVDDKADDKMEDSKDDDKEAEMKTTFETLEIVNKVVNNVNDDDDNDDDTKPDDENLYQVPPKPTPVNMPPKFKFSVTATHKYDGEDDDELCFEKGEVIHVVEYDDPEEQKNINDKKKKSEQDPGWLMGVKASNGKKGVFPQNFTDHA